MSRVGWLLTVLVVILLGVLWWFLLWSPTSDEIASVRADTESTQALVIEQRQREAQLREIRESAPEIEAELNTAQVLIPDGPALPALFRQLQQAADESGVRLESAAPARPADLPEAPAGLSSMQVNINVEGTYFQLVDLARRLEDPAINGRGLLWRNATLGAGSELPLLAGSLSIEVFTRTPAGELPLPEDEEGEGTAETDGESDTPEGEPGEPAPPDTGTRDDEEEVL